MDTLINSILSAMTEKEKDPQEMTKEELVKALKAEREENEELYRQLNTVEAVIDYAQGDQSDEDVWKLLETLLYEV